MSNVPTGGIHTNTLYNISSPLSRRERENEKWKIEKFGGYAGRKSTLLKNMVAHVSSVAVGLTTPENEHPAHTYATEKTRFCIVGATIGRPYTNAHGYLHGGKLARGIKAARSISSFWELHVHLCKLSKFQEVDRGGANATTGGFYDRVAGQLLGRQLSPGSA